MNKETMAYNIPEKLPITFRFTPNHGRPLRNAELAPLQNLPRRERKAALRAFRAKLAAHISFRLKHGIVDTRQ
jgi:hypothetical protein